MREAVQPLDGGRSNVAQRRSAHGEEGKRYRIAFHNGMEDSHRLHLHRHSFEVTSVWGKPRAGITKDTINVPKNSTVEVDFVANNAGPSLVHCHMQQHMDFGFKALVKYD